MPRLEDALCVGLVLFAALVVRWVVAVGGSEFLSLVSVVGISAGAGAGMAGSMAGGWYQISTTS